MEILTILIIALGLSFDSFAVSVSCGIFIKKISFLQAFRIAFWLALFQGLMPLIGWVLGQPFKEALEEIDHWIAFILLAAIGGKMIYEAIFNKEQRIVANLSLLVILGLALATSIDALAVGFSFALIKTPVIIASLIIALVTGLASMAGMYFGKKIGFNKQRKIEILGGIVLILIGLKILIDHTLINPH